MARLRLESKRGCQSEIFNTGACSTGTGGQHPNGKHSAGVTACISEHAKLPVENSQVSINSIVKGSERRSSAFVLKEVRKAVLVHVDDDDDCVPPL